jgi:hypothetical protein
VATTLTRSAVDPARDVSGLRLEPRGHRRRPALAVGSVALVVACVAVFVSVYLRAGHETSVLGISQTVSTGQILEADDLVVVRISMNSGIATVPAADASVVVGRRAAERLEPDTLLTANELVASYSPPPGEAVVGVAAKDGQFPSSGVTPGETVDVVLTGLPGQQDSSSAISDSTADQSPSADTTTGEPGDTTGIVLVPDAVVLESAPAPASSGSDGLDVSLLTPVALAPLVASASTAGQIALVGVASGS